MPLHMGVEVAVLIKGLITAQCSALKGPYIIVLVEVCAQVLIATKPVATVRPLADKPL